MAYGTAPTSAGINAPPLHKHSTSVRFFGYAWAFMLLLMAMLYGITNYNVYGTAWIGVVD